MSYEGYEIYLCEQGHRWSRDVYSPKAPNCPHCKGPRVWTCSIDQTNGDESEPKLEVAEPAPACGSCSQPIGPTRYVVPEKNVKPEDVEQEIEEQNPTGLQDFVEALTILMGYDSEGSYSPTNCQHDILRVYVSEGNDVTEEDAKRLNELGFDWDGDDLECWYSFRFGSN